MGEFIHVAQRQAYFPATVTTHAVSSGCLGVFEARFRGGENNAAWLQLALSACRPATHSSCVPVSE